MKLVYKNVCGTNENVVISFILNSMYQCKMVCIWKILMDFHLVQLHLLLRTIRMEHVHSVVLLSVQLNLFRFENVLNQKRLPPPFLVFCHNRTDRLNDGGSCDSRVSLRTDFFFVTLINNKSFPL